MTVPTQEALLDGIASAFSFFGGVPQSVLLDNMKLAVKRILPDGRLKHSASRKRATAGAEQNKASADSRPAD